jgi:hypothetical protein
MNLSDLQRSKRISAADCEPAETLANANASRPRYYRALLLTFAMTALCPASIKAQTQPQDQTLTQTADESTGKTHGDYNIQQSVEFGYRDSMIGGNLNNYNTFENLSSGVRLFDYTVTMRSINHQGILFDNLSFSNFGYGGDPNDVSRLRIEKKSGTIFARCTGVIRISGTTTCSRTL